MARDLRLSIQGDSSSADRAFASATAALERASKELRQAEARTDALAVKARKLAEAEERAGDKTRDLALKTAALRKQIEDTGDETGDLGRKLDRLTRDTKVAAEATDDYRRAADRAAGEARDQARAYDKVAENAREAARAVAALGTSSALSPNGRGGGVSLDRQILQAKIALKGLGDEFARTGNKSLGDEFDKQSSALARLEAAARRIKKLDDELKPRSGGFFGRALGGFGDLIGDTVGLGTSAGGGLLSTPIVGPVVLGAGAAAAAAGGAFVGAGVGGAVGLGLGAAGAGAGLAGAWGSSTKFSNDWNAALDRLQKRFKDSSAAFGDELNDSLKIADQTLRNLPVEKVLALSQSFVRPLASGAGLGVQEAANGIADALTRVQPIVDNVGPKLANFGRDVGDAFRIMSGGSEGASHALGDFIDAAGYTVKAISTLILGAEQLYEQFRDSYIATRDFVDGIPLLGDAASSLRDHFFKLDSTTITLGRTLDKNGESSTSLGSKWLDMAKAGAEAQQSAMALNDALTETRNTELAMADANLGVAQGWLDLKQELKDGAKSLDLNTQAGLDNAKGIEQQVILLEKQREQAIETGHGTADAIAQANVAYDAGIERIKQMAHQAGLTDAQVDALLRSYGAIPPDVQTDIKTPGLQQSRDLSISLGNALNNIDGRTYHATVDLGYTSHLPSGVSLGALLHRARGGTAATAGATVVGEHGAEAVWLNRGAYVSTAEETRKLASMASGGGSGGSSGGATTRVAIDPGAPAAVAQLVQYLIDRGMIQAFDSNGRLITTRRG